MRSFLSLLVPVVEFTVIQTSSTKAGRISPSWFYYPEYLLSAAPLVRSDDEQTRYETHVYTMMLRRIKPTERCYEELRYEGLSTMDNATKKRIPTKRTDPLSFDWRRVISCKITQRHSSRG